MNKTVGAAVTLSLHERHIIRQLAEGHNAVRDQAEEIYLKNVRAHVESGRKSTDLNFLSEMFNVCPDATLKKIYRDRLLAEVPTNMLYDAEMDKFFSNDGELMPVAFRAKWWKRRMEFPQQKHC